MTDAPDSVERLLSILESWCERSETHHEQCGCQMARRFREAFVAEQERYAKLEAENARLRSQLKGKTFPAYLDQALNEGDGTYRP